MVWLSYNAFHFCGACSASKFYYFYFIYKLINKIDLLSKTYFALIVSFDKYISFYLIILCQYNTQSLISLEGGREKSLKSRQYAANAFPPNKLVSSSSSVLIPGLLILIFFIYPTLYFSLSCSSYFVTFLRRLVQVLQDLDHLFFLLNTFACPPLLLLWLVGFFTCCPP